MTKLDGLVYRPIVSLNRPVLKPRLNRIPKHMHNIVERFGWSKVRVKGQDLIVAICGGRGTGKTNTAGYLAETWDSTGHGYSRFPLYRKGGLTPMDNMIPSVCYSTDQLNEFWKWQSYLFEKHGSKATMGRVCIVEEAQNLFNSREYYSRKNLHILKNFLTGRSFGNIYILTYPSFERIDSQIKELVDLRIDMGSPDFERGQFRWKAKKLFVLWNGDIGGTFFRERINGKSYVRDDFYYTPPPSKELYDLLKLKGDAFKLAVREGRVTRDGNISSAPVLLEEKKPRSNLPEKLLVDWAEKNFFTRKRFFSVRGKNVGDFSIALLGKDVGGLTRARFVVDYWRNKERSMNLP